MREINSRKLLLARIFRRAGLNSILRLIQNQILGVHARVINYHDVSADSLDSFAAQLEHFRAHYVNVGRRELDAILAGTWKSDRPGLMITFDDGLRSHAQFAAPLLEEYGFRGWFFVPTEFVKTPVDAQLDFASNHSIVPSAEDFESDRVALSWDEIRHMDEAGHTIGSHSCHHERLASSLPPERLESEIFDSKAELERQLGHEVDVFCWVGGEEWSYSRSGAEAIRRAGYRLSFMTNNLPVRATSDPLQIQRTNVEAWFPLDVVEFQLNGLLDLVYTAKRRRIVHLTAEDASP